MGAALHRLVDELTATLAGVLSYIAVLALLGMGVVCLLQMDEVGAAIESVPRTVWVTGERPRVLDEGTEAPRAPKLRASLAAR